MNTATLSTITGENGRIALPYLPEAKSATSLPAARPEVRPEPQPPVAQPSRKPWLKRAALASLAAVAVIAAAKFGHDWWTVGRFMVDTDDAYIGGDVTALAPKVPGFIAQVAVQDNQVVHAGDLLIKLDDRDYAASLAKAEAFVANQQAVLANLEATRSLQEALVAQAQAEINSADAETSRAREDETRYERLAATAAVSVQSLQKAQAEYKQATAAGEKTRATLLAAQRQLAVIGTQKQQAQAALEQARAERDLARLNLEYTEIRAPIDGIVGNRSARSGAYATAGAPLVSLVPVRGLWIDANFKESQLARMTPGAPAEVRVDLLPGRVFAGRVTSIAPATGAQFSVLPPENATGNFTKIVQRVTVRITLDDEASALGQLRPGLSVNAEVDGRAAGKAGL